MYPVPASPLKVKSLSSAQTGTTLLGISYLDLRLLDHYCNSVAPIISAEDHLRRMWQYEFPHQAKTHSFLMHSILSTSAYHLCCAYATPLQWQQERSRDVSPIDRESILVPPISPGHAESQIWQSNRYKCIALERQRLALQDYIPNLYALTSHNQEALCAASALLSLNAVASTQNRYCPPGLQSHDLSPIDDWMEISVLVRGVNTVVQTAGTSIMDGALQPLLRHRRVETSSDGTETDVESQVRRIVSPHVLSALDALGPAIDHCTFSEADKEILRAALGFLRISFAVVVVNPEHESIVMVWSNLLDAQFFPLVKRRNPMALVLLAYWTVPFGTFHDRWWIGGLNITILRHITELLVLLDERNDAVSDEHVQGDCAIEYGPLERNPDRTSDLMAGKAKWRGLLEWPLRENGIHDL